MVKKWANDIVQMYLDLIEGSNAYVIYINLEFFG